MATRPSTLDITAFPVLVGRNMGDQCAEGRPIARVSSLPAVACRRRRRRSYRRPLSVRAGSSSYTDLHHPTAPDTRPEVEFSPRVDRSWSTADMAQLSSSSSSSRDSVFRCGNVTAATSFQTCVDEEEEDPAVTTSSVESEPATTVIEEPPPRRRGVVHVKSHLSASLKPPRHDNRHLRPPAVGSRDRRSASMGAVRPSTIFQSPYDNCNTDFGEWLTTIELLLSLIHI